MAALVAAKLVAELTPDTRNSTSPVSRARVPVVGAPVFELSGLSGLVVVEVFASSSEDAFLLQDVAGGTRDKAATTKVKFVGIRMVDPPALNVPPAHSGDRKNLHFY